MPHVPKSEQYKRGYDDGRTAPWLYLPLWFWTTEQLADYTRGYNKAKES